jgi:hypothetical protein
MKVAKYKILFNKEKDKYRLVYKERPLAMLEILIVTKGLPTSIKVFCFIPVFGLSIVFAIICLVAFSRDFWQDIEYADDPLDLIPKMDKHRVEFEQKFKDAYIEECAWTNWIDPL